MWGETLSVDVDEIDDDHRRLVELFNILNHAVVEDNETDYVDAVLDELISGTVWHFRHEERLMLKHGYDGLEEHKAEHEDLIDSAKQLQQKYLQRGKQLSNEDIDYLEHWLTGHILSADKDMGAYLARVM
jgi:hemerythrin-like metal-binding protein